VRHASAWRLRTRYKKLNPALGEGPTLAKNYTGCDLLGAIPDKLIYLSADPTQGATLLEPIKCAWQKWFTVDNHRGFTGRILAQFALAKGWSEAQTAILIEAWQPVTIYR
jgi:hypothetical protein